MINNFSAKKLGEVLAFAKVGVETIERSTQALEGAINSEEVRKFMNKNKDQVTAIENLATREGIQGEVNQNADDTWEELRSMREVYLKDNWEDPSMIMEWLGFLEGAALVHWNLVRGAAENLKITELMNLAEMGRSLHENFLKKISDAIKVLGKKSSEGEINLSPAG